MKKVAANLALLAAAVVVSMAVGEAAMRSVVTLPLPRRMPEVKYAPHPVRRFTLLPDQAAFSYGARATIGSRGFRANGTVEIQDAPTVLALGDSFTFGLGVNDDETWPAQLERRVRESGHAINVVNAGTISYGVFQELDLLKTVLATVKPRVVVHGLYWNDYMTARPPAATDPSVVTDEGYFVWDQPAPAVTAGQQLRAALNHSALIYAVKQVVAQARGQSSTSEYSTAYQRMVQQGIADGDWQSIEEFYRELLALGRNAGFATVVVIMPVNDLVRQSSATHPYPAAARKRLDALGIPYVDAFELWEKSGYGDAAFLPQGVDAHLNAAGYRVLADALAQQLETVPAIAQRIR